MGDFHAKIGENIKRYEKVMDERGFGMSENSELFADFADSNVVIPASRVLMGPMRISNVVIGGSLNPHKPTCKVTRVLPNQRIKLII